MKTWTIAIGPVLPPKTEHFNLRTLAPIKYLSSDSIVTRSICRLCRINRSCTSRFHICNPTNIRLVATKTHQFRLKLCGFRRHSTTIGWIGNLNVGGQRVVHFVQSTYWSCHDTITTQILNYSPSCRNHNMELVVAIPNQIIDRLYKQKNLRYTLCPIIKMGVNRVSMISGNSLLVINTQCINHCLYIQFWSFS
jgi:hypothetical protein